MKKEYYLRQGWTMTGFLWGISLGVYLCLKSPPPSIHSGMMWTLAIFGAGFAILIWTFIYVYFIKKGINEGE